jgi:predicted O-methyltransferase YrrM
VSVSSTVRTALSHSQVKLIDGVLTRIAFIRRFGVRYYRMSLFKSIDGFLLDEEAVQIFDLAHALRDRNVVVVEIGSWLGKSSVVIGSALRFKKAATLNCIDPFDASGDARSTRRYHLDASRLPASILDTFKLNVRRAGISKVVRVLQGLSHQVVKGWNGPIDMLFIDGNHELESVRQDFLQWSPFVKPGGIVAFHDTYFSPPTTSDGEYHAGPGKVVTDCVLGNPSWERVAHVGSLFVCRKVNRIA